MPAMFQLPTVATKNRDALGADGDQWTAGRCWRVCLDEDGEPIDRPTHDDGPTQWHGKDGHTCDPRTYGNGGALDGKKQPKICDACSAIALRFCSGLAARCEGIPDLKPLASWLCHSKSSAKANSCSQELHSSLTKKLMLAASQPSMKRIARSLIDDALMTFIKRGDSATVHKAVAAAMSLQNKRLHPNVDVTFMSHYDAATAPSLDSHKIKEALSFIAEMDAVNEALAAPKNKKRKGKSEDSAEMAPSKVVIFSKALNTLQVIADRLHDSRYRLIFGSSKASDRAKALTDFRSNSGVDVLLISVETGALGVTLTVADRLMLLEPCDNPSREAQLINRIHRIGQTKPCTIVKLYTESTVEERILNLRTLRRRDMQTDEEVAAQEEDLAVATEESLPEESSRVDAKGAGSVRGAEDLRFLLGLPLRAMSH